MSRPSLSDGKWHYISSIEEYNNLSSFGKPIAPFDLYNQTRVHKGTYVGPGKYLELANLIKEARKNDIRTMV